MEKKGLKNVTDSPTLKEMPFSTPIVDLVLPPINKKHKRKERSKKHS